MKENGVGVVVTSDPNPKEKPIKLNTRVDNNNIEFTRETIVSLTSVQ